MVFCRVCSEPFEAENAMRRDCFAYGFCHLNCIGERDLEKCHACGKDPMTDWTEGLPRCCLRPFNYEFPPPGLPEGTWTVELANFHLNAVRIMVAMAIEEMASGWTEKVRVSDLEVGASLLDGAYLVDRKFMPSQWTLSRKDIKVEMSRLIGESVDRWAGAHKGTFNVLGLCLCKLDRIVELTVRFTCTQWATDVVPVGDRSRPFETKCERRKLGTWNCFACLSGFDFTRAHFEPRAKRCVLKQVD